MSSPTVLLVNEEPLSLEQTFDYLHISGKFPEFMLNILSQHALAQELQPIIDLLPSEDIEQLLIDFRTENELTDDTALQAWLTDYGISYATFRQQLIWDLALDDLKHQISQPRLSDYFQECKPFLDRVVLSWIGVDTEKQATHLRSKLNWGTKFAHLVKTHANPDREDSAALEVSLRREDIPDAWLDVINIAQIGTVVGPIATGDQWYLFRVEAFQPAELDATLEAELRDELFEQWLSVKVQDMTVKLQLN